MGRNVYFKTIRIDRCGSRRQQSSVVISANNVIIHKVLGFYFDEMIKSRPFAAPVGHYWLFPMNEAKEAMRDAIRAYNDEYPNDKMGPGHIDYEAVNDLLNFTDPQVDFEPYVIAYGFMYTVV